MEEIITLKSCLDVHVDGGDGTTNAERAAQQYDRFAKTSLCQMVEAVEKAKNGVVMAQESDEAYGWRLVNALLESCKNPYKKNFYYLNENCDLYTTYRTFYRWKRSFIEDIAIQLGLIDEYNGMLESWEA
jgi:hypothetical protein